MAIAAIPLLQQIDIGIAERKRGEENGGSKMTIWWSEMHSVLNRGDFRLVPAISPSVTMPSAFGGPLTTFEDSEKESEYGYVRKVRIFAWIV
nr:V-type proton ATPase catalytic subunit A-like [Ipomoea batatas]